MTTKNPRVNVTFTENMAGFLVHLAHQENQSVSSLVRDLTIEALERREDLSLSLIAEELDQDGVKTYTHEETWK